MELRLPNWPIVKKHPRVTLAILIGFFVLVAWIIETPQTSATTAAPVASDESMDTFIPDGFVLVPIEIQNLASVDSILGQYGVVDIYSEGEASPIGRGLKLIRSPRDPSQFAVMVPEPASREVVRFSAKPFQVVVQNPKQSQSKVRMSVKQARIRWED